jgi:hypothetical protein
MLIKSNNGEIKSKGSQLLPFFVIASYEAGRMAYKSPDICETNI